MFVSLFNRSGPRSAAGDDRSPYGNFFFEPVGVRTAGGMRVTADTALALPAVFAAVRVLSESFACMPFMLFQPKAGGGRTRNTKHWLYRLISKRPNKFQTPYEWRLMLQGHLVLRGNAFCQITADGSGAITDLLPLHPDRMRAELLTNGSYRYRYTNQQGQAVYYRRDEVWHLRGLSSDGIVGLNPIEIAHESIGEALALQSYSSRFFANDAKPGGGWIELPAAFRDSITKQAFRDSWHEMQGGANRGKVAVLERGMKFHELGMNNSDSQFVEARGLKVSDIARIFRVPNHKLNDLSKSAFSNIEQQSIEFWTDTMLPYAELWESSLEYFLLGDTAEEEFDPEFDMSRMLRGDSAARTAYYQGGINSGWLTRNEAREAEGYDPRDGLDEPLRPLNMVQDSAVDDTQVAAEPTAPVEPTPDARMAMLVQASSRRLARRAAAALEKKPVADVFDADFAALVADALAISDDRAEQFCALARDTLAGDRTAADVRLESMLNIFGGVAQGAPAARVTIVSTVPSQTVNHITVPERSVTISAPVTLDAKIEANRTVTKTVVSERLPDGTIVSRVTEDA